VAVATRNERFQSFVEHGRQGGTEVVAGGEFGEGRGALSMPTVLAKVATDVRVRL
jgi:acyl-CoA reductase-like NAD-dependent aldehyde dehydrogenase